MSTQTRTQGKVELGRMSECPQHSNELMDIEPRLLLQTLLDWEDDYAPPPHLFHHQRAEKSLTQAEEAGSKSVPRGSQGSHVPVDPLGPLWTIEV